MSTTADTDEEKYTITPYGLLGQVLNDPEATTAIDTLTLYMLRHAEPEHFMGIVAEGGHLRFVQVKRGGE